MTDQERQRFSRTIEDWGFIIALCIGALFSVGEFLVHIGLVRPPPHRDFPYVTVILFIGCVLPKTLGRVTTGKIWVILAQGVARMFSRKSKEKTDEHRAPEET